MQQLFEVMPCGAERIVYGQVNFMVFKAYVYTYNKMLYVASRICCHWKETSKRLWLNTKFIMVSLSMLLYNASVGTKITVNMDHMV